MSILKFVSNNEKRNIYFTLNFFPQSLELKIFEDKSNSLFVKYTKVMTKMKCNLIT